MTSSADQLLSTVTARQWLEGTDELRHVVSDTLLEVLPPHFTLATTLGHEVSALPWFVHEPSKLGFYLVFGDRCVVGRTREEAMHMSGGSLSSGAPRPMEPVEVVDLAPFLIAETVLDGLWWPHFGRQRRPLARELGEVAAGLRQLGFSLPSEAELDLAWRLSPRLGHAIPNLWTGVCAESLKSNAAPVARVDGQGWFEGHAGWPERELLAERDDLPVRLRVPLLPDAVAMGPDAVAARAARAPLGFPYD
ncbi:MAG: hypothetical protein JNG84_03015 [Archangium sp.]|nr:hypothetical protein [Archangium sp.]